MTTKTGVVNFQTQKQDKDRVHIGGTFSGSVVGSNCCHFISTVQKCNIHCFKTLELNQSIHKCGYIVENLIVLCNGKRFALGIGIILGG